MFKQPTSGSEFVHQKVTILCIRLSVVNNTPETISRLKLDYLEIIANVQFLFNYFNSCFSFIGQFIVILIRLL
jgi:hypothetical protein